MILSSSQLQWLCIRGTAKYVWWTKSVSDLVYDIVYWAENLEIVDLSLQIAVKFFFMTSKVIVLVLMIA